MPKKKLARPRKKRKEIVPPSFLAIECDSKVLIAQSITIGKEVYKIVKTLMPHINKHLIETTKKERLTSQFSNAESKYKKYEIIMIVGHSGKEGIKLAEDYFVDWYVLARWLERFRPQKIIIIGCEAGKYLPAMSMFREIPDLKELYGSPVLASQQELNCIKILVPYLLFGGNIPEDFSTRLTLYLINFAVTRGIIVIKTREDFLRTNDEVAKAWDGLENIFQAISYKIRVRER